MIQMQTKLDVADNSGAKEVLWGIQMDYFFCRTYETFQ